MVVIANPLPHVYSWELVHTLGGFNAGSNWGQPFDLAGANPLPAIAADSFLGAGNSARYHGDPDGGPGNNVPPFPFPWLTWNNRPYVSQMELLLVPRARSSQLLATEYSNAPGPSFHINRLPTGVMSPYVIANTAQLDGDRFGHLANFFQTSNVTDRATPLALPTRPGLNLYRILDLVHVPSRFVGSDKLLRPDVFSSGVLAPEVIDPVTTQQFPQFLRPPHNRLSEFRDPGRVNVNTIADLRVWDGIVAIGANSPVSWGNMAAYRRGYAHDPLSGELDAPDAGENRLPSPTFFANPFRGPGSGELVPLSGTRVPLYGPTTPATGLTQPDLRRRDIDGTLLRVKNDQLPPPDVVQDLPDEPALVQPSTVRWTFNDGQRNPYFRYEQMLRLGSTTTTRSNVYAVWITVGYFEVEPVAANPATGAADAELRLLYPDGHRLGRELGSDLGQVERHKAFYMIDRSIPVAFEPGQNHNVDEAIILRRYIE
jgi:hypothetical protein